MRCPTFLCGDKSPCALSTAAQPCAFASSATGSAQARFPLAGPRRSGSSPTLQANKKAHPMVCFFVWRRRRDSNPRAGFPTYTLSRGASSAYLSTSPNRIMKNMKKMWRRGRDSNSWYLRITGFQDQLLKPLGHLSRYTQPESLFRNRRS